MIRFFWDSFLRPCYDENSNPNSAIEIPTGWWTRNFGAIEREPEQLDGSRRSRMN